MSKRNTKTCKEISVKRLKKHFVTPIVRIVTTNSCGTNRLVKKTLKKVQDVEDSIEIIAREIGRQSKSKK
jgi:hypothetical protein